jgi:hypothetical protein
LAAGVAELVTQVKPGAQGTPAGRAWTARLRITGWAAVPTGVTVVTRIAVAIPLSVTTLAAMAVTGAVAAALAITDKAGVTRPLAATAAACAPARTTAAPAGGQSHAHGPLRTVVVPAVTLPRQGR